MPQEEINVSALLRLKRYEQPPPGYYDQLLKDIHRRQRSELLRRPLWKIACDRLQTYFGEHSMSGVSYAGAMAAVLVVGVAAIGLMTPGTIRSDSASPRIARNFPTPANNLVTLETQQVSLGPIEAQRVQPPDAGSEPNVRPPRYVIDARPVSYELPPSL